MLEMIQNISNMVQICYIGQKEAKGLGYAILYVKTFIGNETFTVLLGDGTVVNEENLATKRLIDAYEKNGCLIMGGQTVVDEDVLKYRIIKLSKC